MNAPHQPQVPIAIRLLKTHEGLLIERVCERQPYLRFDSSTSLDLRVPAKRGQQPHVQASQVTRKALYRKTKFLSVEL